MIATLRPWMRARSAASSYSSSAGTSGISLVRRACNVMQLEVVSRFAVVCSCDVGPLRSPGRSDGSSCLLSDAAQRTVRNGPAAPPDGDHAGLHQLTQPERLQDGH